ncbi:MAG: ribonuclease HI [Bryobacterales bacterium]|nr:ribonuclease HI [Bryobacterales bacterium]
MKSVRLVTDGSCIGNPGPGGWAVILRYNRHSREFSGGEAKTTNNRMEMTAVVKGLQALREPCAVTLEIDSEYVKNGVTRWMTKWKRNGWITTTKQPVKNQDLWQELEASLAPHQVRWVWVKGHSKHKDNNRCDKLAKAAAHSQASQPTSQDG